MSRGWAGGSTRAWRRLRDLVLLRDAYTCRIRLPGVCRGAADCVHHTLGRARTGDNPAYLVAACTPCNLKTGDPSKNNNTDPPGRSATRW